MFPEQILYVVYCNVKFGRKEKSVGTILGPCCELSLFYCVPYFISVMYRTLSLVARATLPSCLDLLPEHKR